MGRLAQRLINFVDAGSGLAAIRAALVAGAVGGVVMLHAHRQFAGLREAEAMDLAQLARQVANGEGFVTRCLRPFDLRWLERAGGSVHRFQDIRHAPAYPWLLAAGYRWVRPSFTVRRDGGLFEPEARVVLPVNVLLTMATALLLFGMGRQLFDGRVGGLAALAYAVSPGVLNDSVSGLPWPLAAFLCTAACSAAAAAAGPPTVASQSALRWVFASLAGVCCALACLTRYELVLLAPAVFLFLVREGRARGWLTGLLFAAVVALALAPWVARNLALTGRPLGIAPWLALRDTALFDGRGVDRALAIDVDRLRLWGALRLKLLARFARLYHTDLRTLGGGVFICFFLLSFVHRFNREDVRALRWVTAFGLALLMAAGSLYGGPEARILRVLLPLVLLYAAAFLVVLLGRFGFDDLRVFGAGSVLMLALAGLPALFTLLMPRPSVPYPPYYPPFAAYVGARLEPGEVLCTDIPEATAWYGSQTSLLLPRTADELMQIHREFVGISGVYLTQATGDGSYTSRLVDGPDRDWLPVLDRMVPEGFPWTHGIALPPGTREQLFLSDRSRWPELRPRAEAGRTEGAAVGP